MNPLFIIMMILFFAFMLFIGILLSHNPGLAIDIQRRFYAKINWKLEPISMPKELRNTRTMGWFLITSSLLVIAYLIKISIK